MVRYALLRTALDPILAVSGPKGLVRLEFLPEAWEYHTRAHAVARRLMCGSPVATSDDDCLEIEAAEGADESTPPTPALPSMEIREDPPHFQLLQDQLAEYFIGRREAFSLDLDLHGTPFQIRVWRQLMGIPYGKLRTYGQVARQMGRPTATRAVGQAAGHNPLPILVPCHRVIGKGGSLVGFAGGLTTKARLLRLEGHTLGTTERIEEPRLF
jgi:methylated-DNA-[protein]-cysteine S-methyltransferase